VRLSECSRGSKHGKKKEGGGLTGRQTKSVGILGNDGALLRIGNDVGKRWRVVCRSEAE